MEVKKKKKMHNWKMCQGCMGHLRGPSVKPVAFDCIPIEAKLG